MNDSSLNDSELGLSQFDDFSKDMKLGEELDKANDDSLKAFEIPEISDPNENSIQLKRYQSTGNLVEDMMLNPLNQESTENENLLAKRYGFNTKRANLIGQELKRRKKVDLIDNDKTVKLSQ